MLLEVVASFGVHDRCWLASIVYVDSAGDSFLFFFCAVCMFAFFVFLGVRDFFVWFFFLVMRVGCNFFFCLFFGF